MRCQHGVCEVSWDITYENLYVGTVLTGEFATIEKGKTNLRIHCRICRQTYQVNLDASYHPKWQMPFIDIFTSRFSSPSSK